MSAEDTQRELDKWEQAKKDEVLMKKIKKGQVDAEVLETEEEDLTPKTFGQKLSNFWYHHKWGVLGGALAAFIVVFMIADLVTKEKSDITICIATVQNGSVLQEDLEALFAPYTSDIDENGEQHAQVSALDMKTDVSASDYSTLETQLTVTLTSQVPAIYLIDEYTYQRLTYYEPEGRDPYYVDRFLDLEQYFPDNPYVVGDRYYLAGSPLEEKMGWSEIPDDFALAIKLPYTNASKKETAEYEEALATLIRLINDEPLDTVEAQEALVHLEEVAATRREMFAAATASSAESTTESTVESEAEASDESEEEASAESTEDTSSETS